MQRPTAAPSTTTQSSEGEARNSHGHVVVTQGDIEASQAMQASQAKQIAAKPLTSSTGFTPYFA